MQLATDRLLVRQELGYDGYYKGSFIGEGIFAKEGLGTLALNLTINELPRMDVLEGKLISNVQSLGDGIVNISSGAELSIFQNNAGSLRAEIRAVDAEAELRFKPYDFIRYRTRNEDVFVGNLDAGVVDIVVSQASFQGQVIVEDGTAIVFSEENNNAFRNASVIRLLEGPSGRQSWIGFNDTDQIINNLEGDDYTAIFLGRGDITLVSRAVTNASAGFTQPSRNYAGSISGVGNFIKEGALDYTLSGTNTYFGATVVREGALVASSALAIGNTSGLVMRQGAIFTAQNTQSIGALFGQASTGVTFAGALTIGVSDNLLGKLQDELDSLPDTTPDNSPAYYLATETEQAFSGITFNKATTLGYLVRQYGLAADLDPDGAGPGLPDGIIDEREIAIFLDADGSGAQALDELSASDIDANRGLLAFNGTLTIGGALTKVGVERLSIRGGLTMNGVGSANRAITIEQGTLDIGIDTLAGANPSSVAIGELGALEFEVTGNRTMPVDFSGSGTLRMTGSGNLRVDRATTSAFDGLYDVVGRPVVGSPGQFTGGLTVVFKGFEGSTVAREGDVQLNAGTSFTAIVSSDLTWNGEVRGDGAFIKQGLGTLTVGSTEGIYTEGKVTVEAGKLSTLPMVRGDLEILAGATFETRYSDVDSPDFYDSVLSGQGTFVKSGAGELQLDQASPGFTGVFSVTGGSVSLYRDNSLDAASNVTLADNTRLRIAKGTDQSFARVTSTALSTIELFGGDPGDSTTITLNVGADNSAQIQSQFLGFPILEKTGAGKLNLLPGVGRDNEIDLIRILGGSVEASKTGLGGADVFIGTNGTLIFAAPLADDNFAFGELVITGDGKIEKSGAGTVDLTGAVMTDVQKTFEIRDGGTLKLSTTALGGDLPSATLLDNSTLSLLVDGDEELSAADITGEGNLELRGPHTVGLVVGLDDSPAYDGATRLLDGITVELRPGLGSGNVVFGGLQAASGTTLDTSDVTSAEFVTKGATVFAGTLRGDADSSFIVSGDGTLDFTDSTVNGDMNGNLAGYGGTIEIRGAGAILSVGNTKEITLTQGARVELRGTGTTYTAGLFGDTSGTVALGAGVALDLTAQATSLDDGGIARVDLLAGSSITMRLSGESFTDRRDVSLAGGTLNVVLAETTGALRLVSPSSDSPVAGALNLTTSLPGGSTVSINGSVSGGLNVGANVTAIAQGDLRGDVDVHESSTLNLSASNPLAIGGTVTLNGTQISPDPVIFAGAKLTGEGSIANSLIIERGATLAPGFSPGQVTVGTLVNSGELDMELAAGAYDQVFFTNTAELNAGGTGTLRLSKYGAGSLIAKRFTLVSYQALATPPPGAGAFIGAGAAGRFASVTSYGADAPRTLLFYPSALASDSRLAIPGLARDGEVAAYVVRAQADYDTLLAGNPYLTNIKGATRVDLVPVTGGSRSDLGASFTSFGARLAVLSDAALLTAVDNLRPRGHAAVLSGAAAGFRSHADALQRRLEQRRFDGADMSVKTDDWFVDATQGQLDLDNTHEARTTGATAGLIRPLGVDGYWAVSLGVENLKADGGATSYKGNGFRLGAAAGVMNVARTLSLDAGLSFGQMSGDLTRPSLVGGSNLTDPKAGTLGLWVRASAATSVGGLALTPFVSLEHSKTSLDQTKEAGYDANDPLGDSLLVGDVDHTQTAARAGFGLHRSWVSDGGDWRYRLGLEVAYALQLDGDEATLVSRHAQLGGGEASDTFGVLPGDGFSVAPTFTLGTSPDSTFTLGLRLEQGSEGEAASLQLGYRRKF